MDRVAEHFSSSLEGLDDVRLAAVAALKKVEVNVEFTNDDRVRGYDPSTKVLSISNRSAVKTQNFQILLQVALIRQNALLEATLDLARFQTSEARGIAKIGLANYFAGAALIPYTKFITGANECRHDVELLAGQFGASIRTSCT